MLHSSIPRIPLTQEGYSHFVAEEARLKSERAKAQERVTVAREMGDLSENGAYHYGKMELASYSRQLRQVQHIVLHGEVMIPTTYDCVQFGHRVTLSHDGKTFHYLLVSQYESDPSKGKLSIESPLGAALLRKKVGESVESKTPSGIRRYTIQKIS